MSHTPALSIVLATHNRRDVVLETVARLQRYGLPPDEQEIIVVDNASNDGTAEALSWEPVKVIRLHRNRGACARAFGLRAAQGELILMLDDDSCPRPGSIERMIEHFRREPRLGAASFMVHLPDGSQECSALPHVFIGCGAGFRTAALRQVGGLDLSFFMAAEEYDLSFRLLAGGWSVETFADLHVEHMKSPTARQSARTAYYDVRNNLRLIARYLPDDHARVYRDDWLLRYRWLAQVNDHVAPNFTGEWSGRLWSALERGTFANRRLSPGVLERVFKWQWIGRRMSELFEAGVRRIVLADWGKNVYAFVRGAERARLKVVAIADDRFAQARRDYRGIRIVPVADALSLNADAWVVSNMSFVHAERAFRTLRARTPLPVFSWTPAPLTPAHSGAVGSGELSFDWNEANLHAPVHGSGDAAKHR